MDPFAGSADDRTPQVIELVIEETIQYDLIWTVHLKTPSTAITSKATSKIQLTQTSTQTRGARPIARVYPALRERKRSTSIENLNKGGTALDNYESSVDEKLLRKDELNLQKTLTEKEEVFIAEARDNATVKDTEDINDGAASILHDKQLNECKKQEQRLFEVKSKGIQKEQINNTNKIIYTEENTKEQVDLCACHRDCVKKNKSFGTNIVIYNHCYCIVKMECVDGEDCHIEKKEEHQKETSITDCLEEFLAGLHLGHLVDYFKVLGCMCVRDLRLLETPELDAIQLISRRRLLQQLDSITLHHEAPPSDCSLEAWLTWYGLSHISGFLAAIGVHSIGDLGYLKEDDLQLLKPVTRRRLLTCKAKYREKGRLLQTGLIRNDYLM